MKKDVMVSAPDHQPDELAPFLSAAKPLNRLTSDQGRRIKARALETLTGTPLSGFRWRWSTALAALGLVLFGGVAAASAARYGLLPWPRLEQVQGHGTTEKPGGSARARARVRKIETVEPALAPAPMVPPSPACEPSSSGGEPARTAPVFGLRTAEAMKGQRALSPRSMARVDRVARFAPAPSEPATFARQAPLAREGTPAAQRPTVVNQQALLSEAVREPAKSARQPPLANRALPEQPAEAPPAPLNEQAVLSEALRRLRQGHDAAGALALLDPLETSHTRSLLALERSNLQVEALLALGRAQQALSRLDRMALDDLPRSAERYLLRGELRARFQRWPEARDDFEHALSHGADTAIWNERALWGRGVARLRTGDLAGGKADLHRYLTTYPQGRHAAEAGRLLAATR